MSRHLYIAKQPCRRTHIRKKREKNMKQTAYLYERIVGCGLSSLFLSLFWNSCPDEVGGGNPKV
jgi:hypothetical protein